MKCTKPVFWIFDILKINTVIYVLYHEYDFNNNNNADSLLFVCDYNIVFYSKVSRLSLCCHCCSCLQDRVRWKLC